VRRRAKYIVFDLAGGDHLVVHLRMTGRLVLADSEAAPLKHTHVVLRFRDTAGEERSLHFHDTRRFGRLWLLDAAGLDSLFAPLGPEPLADAFSRQDLAALLAGRQAKLKPLLLDQTRLAGLGNIYVDEVLFDARLNPTWQAKSLSAAEVDRLYEAIRRVLRQAVDHRGASLSDAEYRDAHGNKGGHQDHVAVFRQQGRPCPRCGAVIQRSRLAGRGTHFCPQCQPAPR
jgi:formamidopyrimidine-DNA glycosylase